MTGTAESLNLAVASGILLYEVRRRTGLAARPTAPLDQPGRQSGNDQVYGGRSASRNER